MDKTLNDLLDIAIKHEISSQELYSNACEIVTDEKAKNFLAELIEEEKGHQTLLESIKEMDVFDGSILLDDSSLLESSGSTHKIEDSFNSESKIKDILDIALKREYRAMAIFNKMASTTSNNELKSIFLKLAEEEEIHHKNISKKFSMQQGEMGYEM